MSTPQVILAGLAGHVAQCFVFVATAVTLASCASATPRPVAELAPLLAIVAPASECDPVGILVDGVHQHGQWYCSHAPAPQSYEVMFSDTMPRAVRAVGFVAGNFGPDGVGPVRVRVQTGHGVMAEGQTYRAVPRGRMEQMQVIVLPRAVTGDHVVVTFERRSRYATALCLGEIAVWGEDYPHEDVAIAHARPFEAPVSSGSPAPGSESPSSTPPTDRAPLSSESPAP